MIIFLALDLWLKFYYYEEHEWEKEYIDKAKKLVSKVYHSHYAPIDNVNQNVDEEEDDLITHIYYKKQHIVRQNEFELYLEVPYVPRKADPLQWWKVSRDFLVSFRMKNLTQIFVVCRFTSLNTPILLP